MRITVRMKVLLSITFVVSRNNYTYKYLPMVSHTSHSLCTLVYLKWNANTCIYMYLHLPTRLPLFEHGQGTRLYTYTLHYYKVKVFSVYMYVVVTTSLSMVSLWSLSLSFGLCSHIMCPWSIEVSLRPHCSCIAAEYILLLASYPGSN